MLITKLTSKLVGDKRRWCHYKARTRQLPPNYQSTIDALERYLMCFGPGNADTAATMFEDLADLFEQSAANGTPIRTIVGEDPVEFAEAFLRNYPEGAWITRERDRLTSAVDSAVDRPDGADGSSR
jgi:DNA-binding ferritin-like protein (Dps family)